MQQRRLLGTGIKCSISLIFITTLMLAGCGGGGSTSSNAGASSTLYNTTLTAVGAVGSYTLTTTRTSSGITQNGVTKLNVAMPASLATFCSDATVHTAVTDTIGFMGTLNVTNCTFSGTTGQVDMMIDLGVGAGFTTPGSVSLTYTANTTTTGSGSGTTGVLPAGYVSQGGLTWMPLTSTLYTYAQAVTLCSGTINGLSGWRLPTEQELINLATSGAMNGQGWVMSYFLWSSTPNGVGSYFLVDLLNPSILGSAIVGNSQSATCVH